MFEYQPDFLDSATFAETSYRRTWLIEDVLISGQPAIIGGPKKAMKTSLAVDMAISIGTGTPFLGRFLAPRRRNVAVVSGESGQATLQEMALRICKSKKISLTSANLFWSFRLPRLSQPDDCKLLADYLSEHKIQVVFLDPLYLCLTAGSRDISVSNLYDIGPLLYGIASSCLDAGATPVLIHHATKEGTKNHDKPPELDDMAFSGIGEFARQWILLKRQAAYLPGCGQNRLWMVTGGSAGHSGCWDVSIDEGVMAKDFSGRTWRVRATPARPSNDQEPRKRARQIFDI